MVQTHMESDEQFRVRRMHYLSLQTSSILINKLPFLDLCLYSYVYSKSMNLSPIRFLES
jgi:hypothetical protein